MEESFKIAHLYEMPIMLSHNDVAGVRLATAVGGRNNIFLYLLCLSE